MSRYLILLMTFISFQVVYAAGIIVEADSPIAQHDVLAEDVGIEVLDGVFKPILFMGCELPCRQVQTFSTADDDQNEIIIRLFRGRSMSIKEDVDLGTFKLSGIYPQEKGMALIQVLFGVSDKRIWMIATDINGYADILVSRVEG